MMAVAGVEDFVQFFRRFIDLCLSQSWPDSTTAPEAVRIALLKAQHIEESALKMKFERNCFNEFLELLKNDENLSGLFLQNCLGDPPKYILKKIINSTADMNLIDVAFKQFQEIFSEERLINALSDLMVESASKKTLLENMTTVLQEHTLNEFKSKLYLLEFMALDSNEDFIDMLKDCDQNTIDILVICLLKDNRKYGNSVQKIASAFIEVMSDCDSSTEKFWDSLFNVDNTNLIQMCLKHENICKKIFEVLKNGCISINSQLCGEECNTNRLSQLVSRIKKITQNNTLKLDFTDYMKDNDFDITYWGFLS